MKKNILVLFSLSSCLSVSAQEVTSTLGDFYENSGVSLGVTIGEVIINTETDGSSILTQGFHQTDWNFLSLDDKVPEFQAKIFPVPTSDVLTIEVEKYQGIDFNMFDSKGKRVLEGRLHDIQTSLNVDCVATGSYSLILSKNGEQLKKFNLIKTN